MITQAAASVEFLSEKIFQASKNCQRNCTHGFLLAVSSARSKYIEVCCLVKTFILRTGILNHASAILLRAKCFDSIQLASRNYCLKDEALQSREHDLNIPRVWDTANLKMGGYVLYTAAPGPALSCRYPVELGG